MEEKAFGNYAEYLEYIKTVLRQYEDWPEQERKLLEKDVVSIEKKLTDPNLYLGIIGSFSSGKSTFINAMLGRSILPTDAIQGTTVTASILKHSEKEDLEISYTDGTVMRYETDRVALCQKYDVKRPSGILTWLYRLIMGKTGKVRGADRRAMRELFRKLSSTEELGVDVEYATLSISQTFGMQDVAIVDTPGTESQNPRHSRVTKEAIENLCDAFVVVIPHDAPVSESLLEYLGTELKDQLENCIFVVTKVEMMSDLSELPRLLRVMKRRLEKGLGIEEVTLVPMPTLLHLEEVDPKVKKSGLFDKMSPDDRDELLKLYEEGYERIREILKRSRTAFAEKNLRRICSRASRDIERSVQKEIESRKQAALDMQREKLMPLEQFKESCCSKIKEQRTWREKKIKGYISNCIDIVEAVFQEIDRGLDNCANQSALTAYLREKRYCGQRITGEACGLFEQAAQEMQRSAEKERKELLAAATQQYRECPLMNVNVDGMENIYLQRELDIAVADARDKIERRLTGIEGEVDETTSGFFRGLKAFFFNPTEKQKSICKSRLQALNNELQAELGMALEKTLKQGENIIEARKNAALQNWIEKNEPAIRACTELKNQAIRDNTAQQKQAEEILKKLKNYMEQLGGTEA